MLRPTPPIVVGSLVAVSREDRRHAVTTVATSHLNAKNGPRSPRQAYSLLPLHEQDGSRVHGRDRAGSSSAGNALRTLRGSRLDNAAPSCMTGTTVFWKGAGT